MFEIKYFADFSVNIYLGRLIATAIGFIVLLLTNYKIGRDHPIILIHILIITIITSFVSIILLVPESIFINSQLLSLIIFTSALFLSWDVKNQIIVAIYYNLLFASSILLNNESIYFLPSFFAAFIFVIFISLLSIVAAALNYKLRGEVIEKSIEAKNYLENASEGIFRISLDGKLKSVNPAFVHTLKFKSKNQLIDKLKFEEFFKNKEDYNNFILDTSKNEIFHGKEFLFLNYFNEEVFVILNARMIFDKHNNHTSIEGSFLDVTERVNAQKKIKEYNEELKKLNESKDKFFSIVAHDLLSPFSSLIGFSEILHNNVEYLTKKEVKEFSGDIHMVALKSYDLLANLLSWSRIQTNHMQFNPQKFSVHPIIEDIFKLSKGNALVKNLSFNNDVPADYTIIADSNMFNTIIRNLVANSVKFTKDGGRISVGLTEKNDMIEVTVEDTGVGMSEEVSNKLFDNTVHHSGVGTNNEKGTGLGLVLCSEFVERHGGTIHVDSKLGVGSKFIFTLSKNLEIV